MNLRHFLAATLAALCCCGQCRALDSVKTDRGTLPGRLVAASATKIDWESVAGSGKTREIPVNQIQVIFFEEEPTELRGAKNLALGGRYADALAALRSIAKVPDRPEIRQDLAFYTALCEAQLALAGKGALSEAAPRMKTFADAHPDSHHQFEALELTGELLLAAGQPAQAIEYFARLKKAPWPDYAMRAEVGLGRALLMQDKMDEAIAAFDRVAANPAEGDLAKRQRHRAALAKADALLAAKKPDEAARLAENLLQAAGPEDAALLARAYNALGAAQRQAGNALDALLAYLHVDLLFAAESDAHAEALAHLTELWNEIGRADRAALARKRLKENYPESRWSKPSPTAPQQEGGG